MTRPQRVEPRPERPGSVTTSAALLQRAREGDRNAAGALFERHLPSLQRWARGRLPRWARQLGDTADIVQESLLSVFGQIATFEPRREGAFRAYLRQAVLNRIRDQYRQGSRRPLQVDLDSTYPAAQPSPLEAAIGEEATAKYTAALAALSPEEREAVVARIELGYSYEQIATLVRRRTPDAARMMVSRALAKLAREMAHAPQRRDD